MTPHLPMTGQTVLITGATGGIGLATAVGLAGLGARIGVVGRDEQRTAAAVDAVRAVPGSGGADAFLADLSVQREVRALASAVLTAYPRVDVLVNNAGGFWSARHVTADGLEWTFAVNHLAPFLLTTLLLDRLGDSAPARVVTVSSDAHRAGRMDFDDLQAQHGYSGIRAYAQSKLANILFTRELARRLDGSTVTANALHPGTVRTGFAREDAGGLMRLALRVGAILMKSPEQGARTSVYAASSPDLAHVTGAYLANSRLATPHQRAQDDAAAARLWAVSEDLVARSGADRAVRAEADDPLRIQVMGEVLDCTTPEGLAAGVAAAAAAVRSGGVVVLPTDTVYGVGCDAFDASAVTAVLAAKGRGREMPPPVLVPGPRTVDGLAREVPDYARALIDRFWPGALTVVLRAQSSLQWDLGETNGTVAVRMPDDPVALALLTEIGPMAVTSANRTGMPPASTVADAQEQLGDAVAVYLDGGPAHGGPASTIVDCTGDDPVILRPGAVGEADILEVVAAARATADQAAAVAAAAIALEQARLRKIAEREQADRDRVADPRRRPGATKKVAGSRRRPS